MSVILRRYQEDALEIMKNTKIGSPSLIVLPTGSGKGTLFAALANSSKGRVLIVVPSGELLNQGIQKIKQFDEDIDVGKIKASVNELESKIMVGTRQSLTSSKSNRISRMLEHGEIEYIVLDEAHNAVDQLLRIVNKIKNTKIIGMTATPFNSKMNLIFKETNYYKSISEMIDDGYLCEPEALMITTKTDLTKIKMVAGDFKQDELEHAVNNAERNMTIVKAYKEYASDRKATIVFCSGIDHSRDLCEEFREQGIACGNIDSNMNKIDRDKMISDFEKGIIKVLINVNILSTGYDLPKIDCVILAKPTRSKIFYTQAIGRGLRIHTGKENVLIVDIADNVRVHDLMEISNIFDIKIRSGETRKSAIQRTKKEKEDEELRKQKEEIKKLEKERVKQQEMEIIAQRIKMFNKDIKNAFKEKTKYDWFRCDNQTFALTYGFNTHYVIEGSNDKFSVYDVSTDKEAKSVQYIAELENVVDAIAYIEKIVKLNTHTDPNADWKKEPPTEGQSRYCGWAKTKVEAVRYFSSSSIGGIMNKQRRMG